MKNVFQLTIALGLTVLMTTSVMAQQQLGNRTWCPIEMAVQWSTTGTCPPTGYYTTIVPPMSAVPIPMPLGATITDAKGTYVGSNCPFYVGIPCSGFPAWVPVPCATGCGPYQAMLSSWGVVAYY